MKAEADQLIHALNLEPIIPRPFYEKLPMNFFKGSVGEKLEIFIAIPGLDSRFGVDQIGTEPAAVAAFASILEFSPDLLISAGTAGSFANEGAEIGKVYLSKSHFYYHDHRIPISGWEQFGRGGYPSFDTTFFAKELGLDQANISSGNSLDFTEIDLQRISESGAILKEMEAGGIAWLASTTKTPFFAIKSVTNLIDLNPNSPEEFEKNFSLAVQSLVRECLRLIEVIAKA